MSRRGVVGLRWSMAYVVVDPHRLRIKPDTSSVAILQHCWEDNMLYCWELTTRKHSTSPKMKVRLITEVVAAITRLDDLDSLAHLNYPSHCIDVYVWEKMLHFPCSRSSENLLGEESRQISGHLGISESTFGSDASTWNVIAEGHIPIFVEVASLQHHFQQFLSLAVSTVRQLRKHSHDNVARIQKLLRHYSQCCRCFQIGWQRDQSPLPAGAAHKQPQLTSGTRGSNRIPPRTRLAPVIDYYLTQSSSCSLVSSINPFLFFYTVRKFRSHTDGDAHMQQHITNNDPTTDEHFHRRFPPLSEKQASIFGKQFWGWNFIFHQHHTTTVTTIYLCSLVSGFSSRKIELKWSKLTDLVPRTILSSFCLICITWLSHELIFASSK